MSQIRTKPELLIVAAIREEQDLLAEALNQTDQGEIAGYPWLLGTIGMHTVRLGVVGVGIASAAIGLGTLLGQFPATAAIMVGSAGALPESGLDVGHMLVVKSEQLAELGVVFAPGMGDTEPLTRLGVLPEIPFDRNLSAVLRESANCCGKAVWGRSLTVCGVSGNMDHARTRTRRFNALAENMEGYALALAGFRYGISVAEIRGISNRAGDRDKSHWDFENALIPTQKAVLELLKVIN